MRDSCIQDPDVLAWINNAFKIKEFSKNKISVLHPMQEPKINYPFGFDFEFSSLILQSKRLKIGNSIYHSIDYKRFGPKTANYIISFRSKNLIRFGVIYYFLQIHFWILALCEIRWSVIFQILSKFVKKLNLKCD